ncbi:hypothetical protein QTP70_031659 [Hemibagrus guttatus]|uniref:THD domain-containing protein n=1 Tax=Hemibagrus guttatus TaxID=175788 RepID=A0AAE0R3B4_9TELE|nr:hypothetical protein QTP70_031659 [Hemibagrus guttatus]
MELKDERTEGLQLRETYTMLMETDAIVRTHRALRRELCISRVVIFILMIACTAFCAILYIQQVPNAKNNGMMSKDKANVRTPPSSARSNLTWEAYPPRFSNITLLDYGESLVFPRGGWYRLGLQITYMHDSTNPVEGQIHLAHKITKYSDSYSEPITVLSVCDTVYKKGPWFKSIFSEVLQVFIKGDRIKVESENALLIDTAGDMWTKNFLTVQFVSEIKDL